MSTLAVYMPRTSRFRLIFSFNFFIGSQCMFCTVTISQKYPDLSHGLSACLTGLFGDICRSVRISTIIVRVKRYSSWTARSISVTMMSHVMLNLRRQVQTPYYSITSPIISSSERVDSRSANMQGESFEMQVISTS